MVIVSAKVSKKKMLLGLLAAAAVIALLVFLCRQSEERPAPDGSSEQALDGATNDARVAYLASFGWEADPTPVQTQEVLIPEEFNDVFTRYNQLQQSQGFDLRDYAGKSAKRYVYSITNYPGGSTDYFATVLVHRNQIIGGDVTSSAQGGTMHGFAMPGSQ